MRDVNDGKEERHNYLDWKKGGERIRIEQQSNSHLAELLL
jgi:hypothetical protein